MANNRMYLVNVQTGEKVLLAKYYPSTGWYLYDPDAIDKAFDKDDFPSPGKYSRHGMYGANPWKIEYEQND